MQKKIKIVITERRHMLPCGHSIEEQCGCESEEKSLPNAHQGQEGRMYRTQLAQMISDATMLLNMFEDETDLPEWLEVKITKASDYISSATKYLAGEKSREMGRLSDDPCVAAAPYPSKIKIKQ
tara:strand:+ start:1902 stop:2273 length:372 start_codon:yes stop_codon:yes gene_type:complete